MRSVQRRGKNAFLPPEKGTEGAKLKKGSTHMLPGKGKVSEGGSDDGQSRTRKKRVGGGKRAAEISCNHFQGRGRGPISRRTKGGIALGGLSVEQGMSLDREGHRGCTDSGAGKIDIGKGKRGSKNVGDFNVAENRTGEGYWCRKETCRARCRGGGKKKLL